MTTFPGLKKDPTKEPLRLVRLTHDRNLRPIIELTTQAGRTRYVQVENEAALLDLIAAAAHVLALRRVKRGQP